MFKGDGGRITILVVVLVVLYAFVPMFRDLIGGIANFFGLLANG